MDELDVRFKNMPVAEIASGLASVRALRDLLAAAKDTRDSVKFNEIVIEAQQVILALQDSIIGAQASIDSLAKEKAALEAEIVDRNEWAKQAADYALKEVREGLFVYEFRADSENEPAPSHWACPKCFADRRIQILQKPSPTSSSRKCFHCEFTVDPRDHVPTPRAKGARRRSNWDIGVQ